ncbi:MAG: methyltransferase domain-containing protein [Saprospiraceae bacterium]|nr:methyltransferase domain-containing protein [Saprospiraceae bacterium]
MNKYVHGYSQREAIRLNDQADSLASLIHFDSIWEEGSLILEAGCGIGAQTKTVAVQNPNCKFISIDISKKSIIEAKDLIDSKGIKNVEFQLANIFDLPFHDEYFDHIFICFVLEHLPNPDKALEVLKSKLKTNGTITLIEGDHGSTYFHPDSEYAKRAIQCQIELQQRNGGDANIGRKLFPILENAGFQEILVSPRQIYVDDSNPLWVKGFTRNTFTSMIEGIKEDAIKNELIDRKSMERGIKDLYRTAEGGGTFCYTFFKGKGIKS